MTLERIVVGVDGSAGGELAVELAGELAAASGAEVVAVNAFEPLAYLGKVEPPLDFHHLRDDVEASLRDEWCRALTERGVTVRYRVVEDDPVSALVETAEAEGAGLIVVGTRGLGGFKGLVLGSVASKLPQRSRIPVTIVPPPT